MPGRGRGRGGGAGRGRGGRGRGRWGGGRRERVCRPTESEPQELVDTGVVDAEEKEVNIEKDVKKYFIGTASWYTTFEQHCVAQDQNANRYAAGLLVLKQNGAEISNNARVRALAAAWARNDYALADSLLNSTELFGLVEILKALTLLDSARVLRAKEKKLKRLQEQKSKVKNTTIRKLTSEINNIAAQKPSRGSASGAVCKHIRRWVRKLTEEQLEFYALHFPTEPWKKLADICHFNPKKDFPSLPWFLPFCYGAPAEAGHMVSRCKTLTAENVNKLLMEFPIPYSHVRQLNTALTNKSKARIAEYTPKLGTILWYYEELACEDVDEILQRRLEAGERVTMPYGKLMERLLTLKLMQKGKTMKPFATMLQHVAQERLGQINLSLDSPIVVIGDKSGSMEVAIRTSTIIASLLCAITSAKLVFFNTENHVAEIIPRNIKEVLDMAVTVRAEGGTAPAASLWPFYERKEVVKTFMVVTDEEENTRHRNYMFSDLYEKYYKEVYPARLVFISFLSSQHASGDMVTELRQKGFQPTQFKLNGERQDLTKLDNMIGQLSSHTADFEQQLAQMEAEIAMQGLQSIFDKMAVQES